MQAIAGALEGMTRAEAARLAGMERQALRDAVVRYNAGGWLDCTTASPGPPGAAGRGAAAALKQVVLDGPDVEATGLSAWTLPELCREVEERWGVSYHPSHMGKLMRRLGLSRQKARPSHPKADAAAREAFARGAAGRPRRRAGGAHRQTPDAVVHGRGRIGQKGASAIAGSPAASARRACATSATAGPTSSPPSGQQPARASPSCCRRSRPRR